MKKEAPNIEEEKIFGINLGATYSSIAYMDEYGHPIVITNEEGNHRTPSVVLFEDTNRIVGEEAKRAAFLYPDNVVEMVRRHIGNSEWHFQYQNQEYTAEEIAAYILRKLAMDAAMTLGEEIKDVVITCPAYFDISQRAALVRAGEIAGLTVRGVINEATAAAIYYTLLEKRQNQTALVYDLGGSAFDITIIQIEGSKTTVIATGGDERLGGRDWDEAVVLYLAEQWRKQTGSADDPLDSIKTLQDLWLQAEQAKKALATRTLTHIKVAHGEQAIVIALTREKFEELTALLLERTISITHKMIQYAKEQLGIDHLDHILLVGGSTKMPQVLARLHQEFGIPYKLFEPDEAVVKGATLFGQKLLIDNLPTIVKMDSVRKWSRNKELRPNFFTLLDLDPNIPWNEAVFEKALSTKRRMWARDTAGIGAKAILAGQYLQLIPSIKEVMLDETKRVSEAVTAHSELAERQKKRRDEFEKQLVYLNAKATITQDEIDNFINEFKDLFTAQDIKSRITENSHSESQPSTDAPKRIEIFFSYARQDRALRDELEKHLGVLKQIGSIAFWHDRQIAPGEEWNQEIDVHLNTAQIILLLISSDFLASSYCYSIEMQRALERHARGDAYVIPIILRPVRWKDTPFGKLQVLPSGAIPIMSSHWHNRDEAFYDIVLGIRRVIEELYSPFKAPTSPHPPVTLTQPNYQSYKLSQVFVKSGTPHVTFVEHEDFQPLKLALDQPGRGVIIEGPSGVGKTTAIRKAIEDLTRGQGETDSLMRVLSARDPVHRELLQTLPTWHSNTVVIDDFHRLSPIFQQKIVDYLKYLADTEPESKKLVVIGIPQSGQMLADLSFDVSTRIDVFKWGKVQDELILQMIERGERALNIEFDRKTEIALAANGSLNVAQYLCFNLCYRESVIRTQEQPRIVRSNVNTAVSSVVNDLSRKFGELIRRFATMGGPRDLTSLRLLEELAHCENGFLSLPLLAERKRELAHGIEIFIMERWMDELCREYPECLNHLFFDQTSRALVVDDPQLTFYLDKMQPSQIAKEAGKVIAYARRKVFISYSHKDARWLERLRVHLRPLEREGIIDLWADTKIIAGMKWEEEIQEAIDSSTVAIVLISADFLASDFISEHELPKLLLHAKRGGTVILPLIIAPCLFENSGIDIFQTVNSPETPLVEMTSAERERTLVKLAKTISKTLAAEQS